jgi:hypothetical protein
MIFYNIIKTIYNIKNNNMELLSYFSKDISDIILDYTCFETFEEFIKNESINLQKESNVNETVYFEKYIKNIFRTFHTMRYFNILSFLPNAKHICSYLFDSKMSVRICECYPHCRCLDSIDTDVVNNAFIYTHNNHVVIFDYCSYDVESYSFMYGSSHDDMVKILNHHVNVFPIHDFKLSNIEYINNDILNNLDFLISFFKNFYKNDGLLRFNIYIKNKFQNKYNVSRMLKDKYGYACI